MSSPGRVPLAPRAGELQLSVQARVCSREHCYWKWHCTDQESQTSVLNSSGVSSRITQAHACNSGTKDQGKGGLDIWLPSIGDHTPHPAPLPSDHPTGLQQQCHCVGSAGNPIPFCLLSAMSCPLAHLFCSVAISPWLLFFYSQLSPIFLSYCNRLNFHCDSSQLSLSYCFNKCQNNFSLTVVAWTPCTMLLLL